MVQILWKIGQRLGHKILVLSLIMLITLSGLFIFTQQPSYAQSKVTPEEKIDRAYEFREGTGILEEEKQESGNSEITATSDKATYKGVTKSKESKEQNPGSGLLEKAQKLVDITSK